MRTNEAIEQRTAIKKINWYAMNCSLTTSTAMVAHRMSLNVWNNKHWLDENLQNPMESGNKLILVQWNVIELIKLS